MTIAGRSPQMEVVAGRALLATVAPAIPRSTGTRRSSSRRLRKKCFSPALRRQALSTRDQLVPASSTTYSCRGRPQDRDDRRDGVKGRLPSERQRMKVLVRSRATEEELAHALAALRKDEVGSKMLDFCQ